MIAFGSTAFHPELRPETLLQTSALLRNSPGTDEVADAFEEYAHDFAEILTLPTFTGWVRGEDNVEPSPWKNFSNFS